MSGNNPAERYVANRMTPEETVEFEAEMMAREELAADVDVRQRIKAGLQRLEERGELSEFLSKAEARSRAPGLAWAASIAVVLLAATIVFWRGADEQPAGEHYLASMVAAPANGIGDSFLLAATRAERRPIEIRLSRGGAPVRLRLMPDSAAIGPFVVEFAGARQTVAASDGFVDIYLHANEPGTAEYALTVSSSAGTPQTFPLRVVVSP